MAKSLLSPPPPLALDPDAANAALVRARDPGPPILGTALEASAARAAASAPWTDGHAYPVTVSVPKTLLDAILDLGDEFLRAQGVESPKKSVIVATVLRNGLSLMIEGVEQGRVGGEEDQ